MIGLPIYITCSNYIVVSSRILIYILFGDGEIPEIFIPECGNCLEVGGANHEFKVRPHIMLCTCVIYRYSTAVKVYKILIKVINFYTYTMLLYRYLNMCYAILSCKKFSASLDVFQV